MEISQAIKHFLNYLKTIKNASPHTIRNYSLDLHLFKTYLKKELALHTIQKREIRSYLAYLNYKGVSKRTVCRHLSALRSFFKYFVKEKQIQINPLDEINSPKLDQSIPKTLSYEEVEHLFSQPVISTYLGFRDRCLMELFYSSGIRISELAGLNRIDFDFENRRIRVRGKGKKERILPVTQNGAKWLSEYLSHPARFEEGKAHMEKDHEAIFLNKWGKRLTVRSIDRLFKRHLLSSGLAASITPHTIRHTIATHWLEKGMGIKAIQLLLGHDSPSTTTIYTKVSMRLKRDIYDQSHPSAKKKLSEKG